MTREELREHCEKQIKNCEMWATYNGEEPHGKIYEEHKLILELLEQEPKTGYWIKHEHNGIERIKCSECSSWFLRAHLIRNSYCPNCRAKMIKIIESQGSEVV